MFHGGLIDTARVGGVWAERSPRAVCAAPRPPARLCTSTARAVAHAVLVRCACAVVAVCVRAARVSLWLRVHAARVRLLYAPPSRLTAPVCAVACDDLRGLLCHPTGGRHDAAAVQLHRLGRRRARRVLAAVDREPLPRRPDAVRAVQPALQRGVPAPLRV
jgi:hypothetical protein